ncbi:MAG: DNA polymerase III subunit delta' C-terminal domain-containing protein [bacterium]|nr:DNA polymerase III subunit delta' C-terminal domain-containing protein [bacterium]
MSWDNVIGQKRVIEILKRTIENGRIPQAYIFTGTDGTGKRLVAKELAKALNCEKNTGNACNICLSCNKIDRDIHPDVEVISPAGQSGGIKIEQIHAIRERIFLKPLEGKYKFYIIDHAEGLIKPQEASGNALLKLLEEPPNDTIFVLIPTEGQALIPTIVSRCQKIKFDYLSIGEVEKVLRDKFFYNEEDARLSAGFSFGRVDRALSFKDEKTKIEREEVFKNLKSPFLKNLLTWARELSSMREKAIDVLDIMILYMRDILIYKITNEKMFLINADYFKEIEAEQKDTVAGILKKIKLIQKTKQLIEQNINLQLALEVMFMEIIENE